MIFVYGSFIYQYFIRTKNSPVIQVTRARRAFSDSSPNTCSPSLMVLNQCVLKHIRVYETVGTHRAERLDSRTVAQSHSRTSRISQLNTGSHTRLIVSVIQRIITYCVRSTLIFVNSTLNTEKPEGLAGRPLQPLADKWLPSLSVPLLSGRRGPRCRRSPSRWT